MKDGTKYAAQLKKAYGKLGTVPPEEVPVELEEPLRCLGEAILGLRVPAAEARDAIERLLAEMVDWNDIRVSRPEEIAQAAGVAGKGMEADCQRLSRALHAIFDRENELRLGHLRGVPRRDARQYLESLDGVEEFAAAWIMLWGLGGHAIPVNDTLLANLRTADLIHPEADRAEVQAFLERNIAAADARTFSVAMRGFEPTRDGKKSASTARSGKKKVAKKKVAGKNTTKATARKTTRKAAGKKAKASSKRG